jgi:hypothetical protein
LRMPKILLWGSFIVSIGGWLFNFKSGSNAGLMAVVVMVFVHELILLERGPQLPLLSLRIATCVFVSLLSVALNTGIVPRGTPRGIAALVICGSAVGVAVLRFVSSRRKASSGVVAAGS